MKKIIPTLALSLSLWATPILHHATVLESMNAGGYTYIKVGEQMQTYWIAMTQREVHKGESIRYQSEGIMKNFHSKTLNRTFKSIMFASSPANMQQVPLQESAQTDIMRSNFQEKNLPSIAQLLKNRDIYANKVITIKAQVTKVSHGIMKRNWVHLEDGSRFRSFDDLVFTTHNELQCVLLVTTHVHCTKYFPSLHSWSLHALGFRPVL